MEKIKAIVADDEEQLRIFLIKQLSHVWPELIISGESGNGTDALKIIREHKKRRRIWVNKCSRD